MNLKKHKKASLQKIYHFKAQIWLKTHVKAFRTAYPNELLMQLRIETDKKLLQILNQKLVRLTLFN